MKGWERLAITGEGGPIPWLGILVLIDWFLKHDLKEAADITLLSADAYLRQSDWTQLQARDIVQSEHGVAILLGIPERGEATKTGTRQGVRPDYEATSAMLLARKR
eukprot:9282711-Alexandrium_andersonii.AAC.1